MYSKESDKKTGQNPKGTAIKKLWADWVKNRERVIKTEGTAIKKLAGISGGRRLRNGPKGRKSGPNWPNSIIFDLWSPKGTGNKNWEGTAIKKLAGIWMISLNSGNRYKETGWRFRSFRSPEPVSFSDSLLYLSKRTILPFGVRIRLLEINN